MALVFNPFTGSFDYFEPPPPPYVTPVAIAAGKEFTVIDETQLVYVEEIVVDGELILDGVLLEAQ